MLEILLFVLGALAGWAVAHVYYGKSRADMHLQFEAVRSQLASVQDVLVKLARAGKVQLEQDSKGKIAAVITPETGRLTLTGFAPSIQIAQGKPSAGTDPTSI